MPDVPSFGVDDGFAYVLPEATSAEVGAIVRIPLGRRRVRGWVVDVRDGDGTDLKEVLARSGNMPVFDGRMLQVMRWAAIRYVAPLAAVLSKATPPNLPRSRSWDQHPALDGLRRGPSAALSAALEQRRRPSTEVWVGGGSWGDAVAASLAPALEQDRGALLVVPTVVEGDGLVEALRERLGTRAVFASSAMSGADQTAAWVEAAGRPGSLLVGTRTVAFWPVRDLAVAFVVGEGRRGMKDKSTPTTHAREVLVKRSQMERCGLVLAGLVPTAEALTRAAPRRVPAAGRLWGQVEVVDRRLEDSGGALLGPTARAALRAAVADGARVLVFTHRRATAQRCARCRQLRRCATCGAGAFESAGCERCGTPSDECTNCGFARFELMGSGASRVMAEAGRIVGRAEVGSPGDGRPVVVGTERDLPGLRVDLTIIVDADGPILAPTYRAGEDALRLLGRAVAAAGPGRGRRGLVQTSDPKHPVITALRRADPVGFVDEDAANRAAAGFPPGGEVLVIEAAGGAPGAHDELLAAVGSRAEVLGPAEAAGDRLRWLLQGADLTAARKAVRSVVGAWREGGARVRIDADPIDL